MKLKLILILKALFAKPATKAKYPAAMPAFEMAQMQGAAA